MRIRTKFDDLIDQYIEESKKFYPKLEFSSRFSLYGGDEPTSCDFEFSLNSNILSGTEYDCDDVDKLVHYTSNLQNVIEILNSGVLRFGSLTSMIDPQEMQFTNRYLGMHFSEKQISELKSTVHSSSFCSISNDEYPDEFPMWRLYGNDGYGAAIIFKVENTNTNWYNYMMAKMQYGDCDAVSRYKDFVEWHESFQKKHNNPIQNQPKALTTLMALHKNDIWKHENEIRLLTHTEFDKYTLKEKHPLFSKLKHSITRNGELYSFMELPIYRGERFNDLDKRLTEHGEPGYLFKTIPVLRITDIVLGYRVSDNTTHSMIKLMGYYSSLYKSDIYLRTSHLRDYM